MELTKEERTVIADLLTTHGISDYEIVLDAPEGSMPPKPLLWLFSHFLEDLQNQTIIFDNHSTLCCKGVSIISPDREAGLFFKQRSCIAKGDLIVQEATRPLLSVWQNFYVIVGSASAALTGLMFVVVTLIASRERQRLAGATTGAFATPNVVHFCAALLIAAILSAPWPAVWYAGFLLGICGLAGVIYSIVIIRRARSQNDYQPVLEDWLWHTIFPFISYAALVVAALVLLSNATLALFVIGAATLLLLFIGIHNSWDNITYLAFTDSQSDNKNLE